MLLLLSRVRVELPFGAFASCGSGEATYEFVGGLSRSQSCLESVDSLKLPSRGALLPYKTQQVRALVKHYSGSLATRSLTSDRKAQTLNSS